MYMSSFTPVIISAVLGTLYFTISSSGIRIYNNCLQIKDDKKWKNMHALLSTTLIIALVIPGVLLTQFLAKDNVLGSITILYGLLGLIGSSIAYNISKETDCEKAINKGDQNFFLVSIIGSLIVLLSGSGITSFSRKPTLE